MSLAVLMLLSQLDFASAAVRVYNIKPVTLLQIICLETDPIHTSRSGAALLMGG